MASNQNDAASDWNEYVRSGLERVEKLGSRGPMRFDANGRLEQDILDAYRRNGFYHFTGVIEPEEVEELNRDFDQVLDNAPAQQEGTTDRHGKPVKFPDQYSMSSEDLFEETRSQGEAPQDPQLTVGLIAHPLVMMDAALRVYAHPKILKMVESINGPDFVPFHESIFHKGAGGVGPPTPWHQDGRTHWTPDGYPLEQPDGSGKTHGFNFSVSWSRGTPENCLWVVPGSHRRWLLADDGKFPPAGERLPDAVPMPLAPGDCGLVNRSSLHGSFENSSSERRVTMVLGYHTRESVIGTETKNVHAFASPGKAEEKIVKYSEEYVLRRARMIPLAIDARRQRYPDETPYEYKGSYLGGGAWNEQARAEINKAGDEYWQRDITL